MKDYEIFNNDIKLGNVNVFWNNIIINNNNGVIGSLNDAKYKYKEFDNNIQNYIVRMKINNVDDLYDIVSKYIFDEKEIFNKIEEIKKYNNIKKIKNGQYIDIIIPEIYLNNFKLNKNDVSIKSLIDSRIYFIKNVSIKGNNDNLMKQLEFIVNGYNDKIKSNEFSFYTDEEKKSLYNNMLNELSNLTLKCEKESKYLYGKDFLIKLRIDCK